MREIKFRAWNPILKEMEYNPSVSCSGSEDYDINSAFTDRQGTSDTVLLQFTGLLDKNGKEIYEGDIVALESWEPKNMQVSFIEGAFCLANKEGEFVGDIHYIQHADVKQSEIIGNIYENPELL